MKTALALDIGGTDTKMGLVQADGAMLHVQSIPTTGPDPAEYVARIIARLPAAQDVCGLGVALAGFVDPSRSGLAYNPNLAWLEGFDLRTSLRNGVGFDPVLESDSNAACAAEYAFGSGKEARRFLCVTVGTGVGVGMIADGELLRTAHGCLGDAGHVVVEPDGPPCSCGGRGCAEAVIGAAAVAERSGLPTVRDAIAAAQAGDATATEALRQAGRSLGIALASLGQIFFPDRIAIAGGLAEAGALLLDSAEDSFREYAAEAVRRDTILVKADLGWLAALAGAAYPVLAGSFTNPDNRAANRQQ